MKNYLLICNIFYLSVILSVSFFLSSLHLYAHLVDLVNWLDSVLRRIGNIWATSLEHISKKKKAIYLHWFRYRWFTSGIVYDMANYDVRWEGDGTKEILGHSLWVNQDEMNKPGRHVVYTYGGKYIPSPSRQENQESLIMALITFLGIIY